MVVGDPSSLVSAVGGILALPRDRQFLCPKQPGTHADATSSSLTLLQFNGLHTILYKPQKSPVLPNAFNEDEDP